MTFRLIVMIECAVVIGAESFLGGVWSVQLAELVALRHF